MKTSRSSSFSSGPVTSLPRCAEFCDPTRQGRAQSIIVPGRSTPSPAEFLTLRFWRHLAPGPHPEQSGEVAVRVARLPVRRIASWPAAVGVFLCESPAGSPAPAGPSALSGTRCGPRASRPGDASCVAAGPSDSPACGHTPIRTSRNAATRCSFRESTMTGPVSVSIMRQGRNLIASVHTALDDSQLAGFQHDLIRRIGEQSAATLTHGRRPIRPCRKVVAQLPGALARRVDKSRLELVWSVRTSTGRSVGAGTCRSGL